MALKKSIRFFNDRQVRAVWDEDDQLVSVTHDFKFEAPDGKQRASDALDAQCVQTLAKHYPANRANAFLDWFTYSDKIDDRETFMKGIDYSYYYEQEE